MVGGKVLDSPLRKVDDRRRVPRVGLAQIFEHRRADAAARGVRFCAGAAGAGPIAFEAGVVGAAVDLHDEVDVVGRSHLL